jgi:hypothetical protein
MSIWDEPLTKEEYLRRLYEAKAERRKKDAELSFEEKVDIVLALQEASRALRDAPAAETMLTRPARKPA